MSVQLIVDIGNSHTKAAVFDGSLLREFVQDDVEHLVAMCEKWLPERAMICETGTDQRTLQFVQERLPTIWYHPGLIHPISNAYVTPETLGADRIAGAVAAAGLFPGKTIMKIDFGSCNTIDYVDPQLGFMGGSISPGLQMRLRALHQFTRRLPDITFSGQEEILLFGKDTATSIQSGVLQGIVLETDGFIDRYKASFPGLEVVATGGNAEWFASRLKNKIFVRPYLVMEGLNSILQQNV
jgi:type III pantothenate kinase